MEEHIDINSLKANPKNPRRITHDAFTKLKKTLEAFGDLSGIISNQRTGNLVGGHRRIDAFKQMGGQPVIEERYNEPTSKRTVARGYVLVGDEKYSYRIVDWSPETEISAMTAANAAGNLAEWDRDLLAQNIYELGQLENGQDLIDLTALSDKDLDQLNKLIGADESEEIELKESDNLSFKVTAEQRECIEEAISRITAKREMATDDRSSKNGTALYYMSRDYLDRLHGNETQDQQEV